MIQEQIDIPVFYGTFADLTKINLHFINGKIVRHDGKLFKKFFKSVLSQDDFNSDFSKIIKKHNNENLYEGDHVWSYAIIPVDIEKAFESDNWNHFYQLMLSVFPSDFSLIKTINLVYLEDKYKLRSIYATPFSETGNDAFDNFMFIAPEEYRFVRYYLKKYFKTSFDLKYLKYILSVYSDALRDKNSIYKYLSLIICLEVIVEGNEQLTYRLKRNVALLCGQNVESCKIIYNNVGQLYKLRSAIIHGNIKPSYKNFIEYNDYLKMLVAKLIRELIVHNIPTINELNDKITVLGYGQNNLLSLNYKSSKHPILDNIRLSYKTIQEY